MKHSLPSLLTVGAALLLGSPATPVSAATMILHNFTGGASDGEGPDGSVTVSDSKIYGMTYYGGSIGDGTLYSMNTDGTGFRLLHDFLGNGSIGIDDGFIPVGSVTLSGSKLYGMTITGGYAGSGTFFSINTDGTGYSKIHIFTGGASDGMQPVGSPTLSGSKLYGVTNYGGISGSGTVFSISTDGTGYRLLYSFGLNVPNRTFTGGLTLSGSKLFGMWRTGNNGYGDTLYSMNTDGTGYQPIHVFNGGVGNGREVHGSLTLSGSKLFGVTKYGGASDGGTLFSINTDGTGFNLLHSFIAGANDGVNPSDSLTLFGSKLYGATQYGGNTGHATIYGINTDGTGFGLIERESFGGVGSQGFSVVVGDLAFSSNGSILYGTTQNGGTTDQGTVFSRSIATPEPTTFGLLAVSSLLLAARRRRSA